MPCGISRREAVESRLQNPCHVCGSSVIIATDPYGTIRSPGESQSQNNRSFVEVPAGAVGFVMVTQLPETDERDSNLAEALAEACNLPVLYLQGMEGLTLADVLYDWDREAQTQWVRQAIATGKSFDEARAGQWSREFLKLGEALAAYECAATSDAVPILICDEFDKISEKIEDTLLQLFARGYAHVPRFGEIGVRDQSRWPVVILLSNDQRHDLSSPMRSRCLYSWLPPPTPREEVRILKARCPGASRNLLLKMVTLINAIRRLPGIMDKPGLRESIAFLRALVNEEVQDLRVGVIESHL